LGRLQGIRKKKGIVVLLFVAWKVANMEFEMLGKDISSENEG
jgi:hypothetical protein